MKEKIMAEVREHSGGKYVCGKIYLSKELIGHTVEIIDKGKKA